MLFTHFQCEAVQVTTWQNPKMKNRNASWIPDPTIRWDRSKQLAAYYRLQALTVHHLMSNFVIFFAKSEDLKSRWKCDQKCDRRDKNLVRNSVYFYKNPFLYQNALSIIKFSHLQLYKFFLSFHDLNIFL